MNYAAPFRQDTGPCGYFSFQTQEPFFIYHNLGHTQSVVKAATKIGNHYQLSERDFLSSPALPGFTTSGTM